MPDDSAPALPDNVVSDLAELTDTPNPSHKQLRELQAQAVAKAMISDWIKRDGLPTVTTADVVPPLSNAQKAFEDAERALARLQGEGVNPNDLGASLLAGSLLEDELGTADLGTQRQWLAALRDAAIRALDRAKIAFPPPRWRGHPKGTGAIPILTRS